MSAYREQNNILLLITLIFHEDMAQVFLENFLCQVLCCSEDEDNLILHPYDIGTKHVNIINVVFVRHKINSQLPLKSSLSLYFLCWVGSPRGHRQQTYFRSLHVLTVLIIGGT